LNQTEQELKDIKQFYESVYYRNAVSRPPGRHERSLAQRLGVKHGDKVLDVACGTGRWLKACAELGAGTYGIDLSETAIECCRQQLPNGDFHAQAAETLPYDDATFDLVTCLGSLEHFVEPIRSLREMCRVARPEAAVVLLVPNAGFLTRKLGLYGGTQQVDAKEVVRSLPEWTAMFETAGFRIESRWRDLHVLSLEWIKQGSAAAIPLRLLQALALPFWPLSWQYQVFFLCRKAA